MIKIKINNHKKSNMKLSNLIYKYSNTIAYGNQYDEQHKANDRLLAELLASIPAGRVVSKTYPYAKNGFKYVRDWGYKNPDKVEFVKDVVNGLTKPLPNYGNKT